MFKNLKDQFDHIAILAVLLLTLGACTTSVQAAVPPADLASLPHPVTITSDTGAVKATLDDFGDEKMITVESQSAHTALSADGLSVERPLLDFMVSDTGMIVLDINPKKPENFSENFAQAGWVIPRSGAIKSEKTSKGEIRVQLTSGDWVFFGDESENPYPYAVNDTRDADHRISLDKETGEVTFGRLPNGLLIMSKPFAESTMAADYVKNAVLVVTDDQGATCEIKASEIFKVNKKRGDIEFKLSDAKIAKLLEERAAEYTETKGVAGLISLDGTKDRKVIAAEKKLANLLPCSPVNTNVLLGKSVNGGLPSVEAPANPALRNLPAPEGSAPATQPVIVSPGLDANGLPKPPVGKFDHLPKVDSSSAQ